MVLEQREEQEALEGQELRVPLVRRGVLELQAPLVVQVPQEAQVRQALQVLLAQSELQGLQGQQAQLVLSLFFLMAC